MVRVSAAAGRGAIVSRHRWHRRAAWFGVACCVVALVVVLALSLGRSDTPVGPSPSGTPSVGPSPSVAPGPDPGPAPSPLPGVVGTRWYNRSGFLVGVAIAVASLFLLAVVVVARVKPDLNEWSMLAFFFFLLIPAVIMGWAASLIDGEGYEREVEAGDAPTYAYLAFDVALLFLLGDAAVFVAFAVAELLVAASERRRGSGGGGGTLAPSEDDDLGPVVGGPGSRASAGVAQQRLSVASDATVSSVEIDAYLDSFDAFDGKRGAVSRSKPRRSVEKRGVRAALGAYESKRAARADLRASEADLERRDRALDASKEWG